MFFFLFQFDFVVDVVDVVNVDIVVVVVAVVIVVFDFTLMAGPVLTFVPFFFLFFYLSCFSDDLTSFHHGCHSDHTDIKAVF